MSVTYSSIHAAIVITAGDNDVVRLDEAGVVASGTIAPGTYFLRGDGSSGDFCLALATALNGAFPSLNVYTVTVTSNGTTPSWDIDPANVHAKICISLASGAVNFRVKWSDVLTTLPLALVGFATTKAAANTSAEVSTLSPSCVWVPNEVYAERVRGRRWEVAEDPTADGDTDVVRLGSKMRVDVLQYRFLSGLRLFIEENATLTTRTLEAFIDASNDGRKIELHERALSSGTILAAVSDSTLIGNFRFGKEASDFRPRRVNPGLDLFDLDLVLIGAES